MSHDETGLSLSAIIFTSNPPGNAGVIKLESPYKGVEYARIDDHTVGRANLMNENGGQLKRGTKIVVEKLRIGHNGSALVLKVSSTK